MTAVDDAALAAQLATEAGQLAARMRERGISAERKTSVSDIVTEADHAAEALVLNTLQQLRPQDGVLGEEGANVAGESGRRWVIDPVDGTYNFHAGLAYWCSAIALRDDDGPILGAVYIPSADELWLGGRDLPTTLNGRRVEPIADAPLALLSLSTYLHPGRMHRPEAVRAFMAIAPGAATLRMMGSGSCDLANVAGSRLGAWAMADAPEWDWLPGAALVEGAGGTTAVLEHDSLRWHIAGSPSAVRELRDRLALSS